MLLGRYRTEKHKRKENHQRHEKKEANIRQMGGIEMEIAIAGGAFWRGARAIFQGLGSYPRRRPRDRRASGEARGCRAYMVRAPRKIFA